MIVKLVRVRIYVRTIVMIVEIVRGSNPRENDCYDSENSPNITE